MLKLQQFRDKAIGLPDILNFALCPEDGIVQGKDGCLMASWYYRGEDMGSSTHGELASISARLNAALCALGGGWMMHTDLIRRYTTGYPKRGSFPDRTTLVIDEERRKLYEAEGVHLEGVYALTLSFMPDSKTAQKIKDFLYEGGERGINKAQELTDRLIAQYKRQIGEFEGILSGLFPVRRMRGIRDTDDFGREYVEDEQLQFLDYCLSGDLRPVRLPSIPMYLDAIIGGHTFQTGIEPRVDGKLVKVVAIDGFPQDSTPGILHVLDELNCEYRWSTRFIFLDPYQAKSVLDKQRKRWQQKQRGLKDQVMNTSSGAVDIDAMQMTADVQEAMGEAESNLVKFGYYTSVVVVIGDDADQVRENANEVYKAIKNAGFGARIEDINTVEAYLGSIPGHGYPNVRRPILHTLNLADMLPITSVWAGPEFHPSPLYPKKSPPLIHTTTTGSTPFRMCLHVDDVGHSLMLGPTGAGKTTAINTLIAQHFRYPHANAIGLDYKNGSYVLCKAAGGDYYDIGGPGQDDLSFCPLSDLDTTSDVTWASEWLEGCCELQGITPTPALREEMNRSIQRFRNSPTRALTEFCSELQSSELRQAIGLYTMSGPLGGLLDAQHDNLKKSRFMMFEMEHLLEMGDKNALPVLGYVFRQIEKRLNGRDPTFVPCDEAWRAGAHPVGRRWIGKALNTWRSKNANMLIATQQPIELFRYEELRDVILAGCPTRLLLANPEAMESQRPMYEMMGCNAKELEIVANMTKKREYYYKSPLGRRRFSLGLGPVTLAFVGASGKEAVAEARRYMEQYGEAWPAEWLRNHASPEWADYWMRVQ